MTRVQYEAIFGAPPATTGASTRTPRATPPVPPEDPVPDPMMGEVDVWLTQWQVEEDGFEVAVGERVEWSLTEMDQDWVDRLLTQHRLVPLQLDSSDEDLHGTEPLARRDLSGVVTRIDQVSVRFVNDPTGPGTRVPERLGAQQHSVSSLSERRPHHGDVTAWIVRIRS